ncbi:MAG: hypothetical protein LBE56_02135 [Tannerella sp.]|jgi:uncharacterized protein YjaG (DUF416 family)|nr:hypothetical protein [Tannerella sp.]
MAIYQVEINETTPLGQSIVALLKSAKDVVPSMTEKKKKRELTYEEVINKSDLHRHIDSAMKDVRLMLDGKKREKTLDELIAELRNELQNNND